MLATYSLGGYFFEKTYVYTDLLRRWLNLMYRLFPSEPFRAQERTGVCCYNLGFDQYVLERKKARIGLGENIRGVEGHARASAGGGHPVSCFDFPRSLHVQRQRPGLGCLCGQSDAQSGQPVPRAGAAFSGLTPAVKEGGGTSLYFDFAHMTAAGNRVVGDALFHRLRPQLLGSPVEQSPSTPRQGN